MDLQWAHSRKRKRRRGPDRPPIAAQLILDTRLKGDAGVLSPDLFADLFPGIQSGPTATESPTAVVHVAIAPHTLSSYRQPDLVMPWTILAVKITPQQSDESEQSKTQQQQQSRSTLRFPASSGALTSFVTYLQKTSTNIARLALQSSIEIYILDVAPLALDTVVVSLDEETLAKLEAANQRYRKGPIPNGTLKGGQRPRSGSSSNMLIPDDRWAGALKVSLKAHRVIHCRDLLPLPLPSHPITHIAPPPALVELCEPVSQGLVTDDTRVVIMSSVKPPRQMPTSPTYITNGTVIEEDEDTSNEQFYSAAEEKSPATGPKAARRSSISETTDTEASNDDETDLSDGEADTLGLSLPSLPAPPSGTFSTFTAATPRLSNPFLDGLQSPGSAVSGYSMSTVLGGGARGKLFEAHGLLSQIPPEQLHPKPNTEEDEEARAYVDTALLAKIGCFSGDWVRLEAATEESLHNLGSWGFNLDSSEEEPPEWRIARLYALPGQSSKRPRYAINRGLNKNKRNSRSFMTLDKSAPKIHLSPITLANLGDPSSVRVSKLDVLPNKRSSRLGAPPPTIPLPPTAKDVTLQKFSTPAAHERNLDQSLKLALEKYFMRRQRMVKNGDLIAISIDDMIGKALYQAAGDADNTQRDLLASSESLGAENETAARVVAWFKVASMHTDNDDVESPWGPLALIKPEVTKLAQAGDYHGRLPKTVSSSWQYYLGSRRLPIPPDDGTEEISDRPMNLPRSYVSPLRRRLKELLSAATSPQAIQQSLPPLAILLHSTHRHIGKTYTTVGACSDLGMHAFEIDAFDIISEGGAGGGDVKTAGLLEARAERGLLSGAANTCLLMRHVDVLTADRMTATVKEILEKCRILVATTTNVDKVPDSMRSIFTHELEMSAPDEGEREGILNEVVQELGLPISAEVDLSSVAVKTAALVAGDLQDVVIRASVARQDRLERIASVSNGKLAESSGMSSTIRDIQVSGGPASRRIIKADFDTAVDAARKNFADSIGAPKIPNVTWDDVGGLSNVKDAVMETIQLPLERPELFAKGMKKRSGILFYGPPGTGKTLLAKAIATEFSLNFFSVKGPELLNMYIGESEANVRRVFQRARDARPCVVFFDELDSVAPKRGNQGDSGGVMDRIVSQLLAELDGMSGGEENGGGVFVIGATNRPDLLDQALLRPGRFDKMLYLGVSDTDDKQLTIMQALTRKFTLHPSLSLRRVAEQLPFTFTGADLYALCSDAMLKAITRRATAVDEAIKAINAKRAQQRKLSPPTLSSPNGDGGPAGEHSTQPLTVAQYFDYFAKPEDTDVMVEEQDFIEAHRELVPSVSAKELEHYDQVRQTFEQDEHTKKKAAEQSRQNGSKNIGGDDIVARTQQMSLADGSGKGRVNGVESVKAKAKGKGKAKAAMDDTLGQEYGFGQAVDDDEGDSFYKLG